MDFPFQKKSVSELSSLAPETQEQTPGPGQQESRPIHSTSNDQPAESGRAANEQLEDADAAWLASLPPHLALIARRYGKELFQLVMTSGVCGAALGKIVSRNRGNREMHMAVGILQVQLSALVERIVQLTGEDRQRFLDCKLDIERVGALVMSAQSAGEKRTPGGLIIES